MNTIKVILFFSFLVNGMSAHSGPLDFECDKFPPPLRADCPNDEFYSLNGLYPGNIQNPEDYSDLYQWGSDYMNFSYGWYYTLGTARIGMQDIFSGNYPNELQQNIRQHSSGSFDLSTPRLDLGAATPYASRINHSFSNNFPFATSSNHGAMTLGLINAKSNNITGISGLCRNCSVDLVSATYQPVSILNTVETNVSDSPPVNDCDSISSLTSISNLYGPSAANSMRGIRDSDRLENRGVKCVQEALNLQLESSKKAFNSLINSGNQVINLSLQFAELPSLTRMGSHSFTTGVTGPTFRNHSFARWQLSNTHPQRDVYPDCNAQAAIYGFKLDICQSLESARNRDVIVVASAGNNLKNKMAWPASEFNNVIGVAGTDPYGNLWDRRVIESGCLSPNSTAECGSNFDPINTKFAAPAHNVLVYHPFGDYSSIGGCADQNFDFDNDEGYQLCSGTSFSAPYVSGVAAMIRSLNPLVSVDDVKQIMWDSRVRGLSDTRYAIPRAVRSVKITLGKSGLSQMVNRLTPMFRMKTKPHVNYPNQISYLSSTVPQVASAAKGGSYMVQPRQNTGVIDFNDVVFYESDSQSPVVTGYPVFAGTSESARAPFFMFSGHRNPFNNEADDLVPLHHMARERFYGFQGRCTELADHAYSTSKTNEFSTNFFCGSYQLKYDYEGIDGYMLPNCPEGVPCYETTRNPTDLQCLKLRYSVQDNSFALMMASEVNKPMFQSYGLNYKNKYNQMEPINTLQGMANAECLGYVFPNHDSDSDGIIDGMELVLGTDPMDGDTDNDTILDGLEYPLSGMPQSDPLDPNDPEIIPCPTRNCK
ncbi:S8 family peptidase [Marinicella sp. W31]|uniref:S8 family peptidase n=1 Tax=Marinicella sp. W31 TaxID=3023713 RepID=UPI003756F744